MQDVYNLEKPKFKTVAEVNAFIVNQPNAPQMRAELFARFRPRPPKIIY